MQAIDRQKQDVIERRGAGHQPIFKRLQLQLNWPIPALQLATCQTEQNAFCLAIHAVPPGFQGSHPIKKVGDFRGTILVLPQSEELRNSCEDFMRKKRIPQENDSLLTQEKLTQAGKQLPIRDKRFIKSSESNVTIRKLGHT
jgi:hypothetical protein